MRCRMRGNSRLRHRKAQWTTLPKGWTQDSLEEYWDTMTGSVKHKVTKCIKEMKGKVTDPGAFCASLADKVEGKEWRSRPRGGSTSFDRVKVASDLVQAARLLLADQLNVVADTLTRFLIGDRDVALNGLKVLAKKHFEGNVPSFEDDPVAYNRLYNALYAKLLKVIKSELPLE